eukprot:scaffold8254_cov63-Phaeocystis_antarctica.AAC.2
MMRFQHVDPLADTTVGWLLDEWLHRVRLISMGRSRATRASPTAGSRRALPRTGPCSVASG